MPLRVDGRPGALLGARQCCARGQRAAGECLGGVRRAGGGREPAACSSSSTWARHSSTLICAAIALPAVASAADTATTAATTALGTTAWTPERILAPLASVPASPDAVRRVLGGNVRSQRSATSWSSGESAVRSPAAPPRTVSRSAPSVAVGARRSATASRKTVADARRARFSGAFPARPRIQSPASGAGQPARSRRVVCRWSASAHGIAPASRGRHCGPRARARLTSADVQRRRKAGNATSRPAGVGGTARGGGAPERIRTFDLLLRRQTLYPLSYGRAAIPETTSPRRSRRQRPRVRRPRAARTGRRSSRRPP